MWACNCKKSDTQLMKGCCKKVSILGNFKTIKLECQHPERSIQLIVRCEMKKRLVANSWGRFLHCFKIFVGVFWILIWQFVRPVIIDGWYFQRCSLIRNIFHNSHLCLSSYRHLFVSSVHDVIMIRIFLLTLMIEFKVPPSSSRAGIIPFVWIFRLNLLSSINKGDDKLNSLRWIYVFIQIRQQHWDQKIWLWVLWVAAWAIVTIIAFVWALCPSSSHNKSNTRSWQQIEKWFSIGWSWRDDHLDTLNLF